jgi:phosphatidylethanolamine N-methyltransferase
MTMCHASFLAAAWKMYTLPPDWFYDLTVFRLVLGVGMIALHLWTAASIYDSLGEFGWFCGDFFFDPPPKNLTYSGIYRFLNSPERVLGMAGVWGVAVITWTAPIFYLATTAQVLNLAFLHFIERPHMNKVRLTHSYGLVAVARLTRFLAVRSKASSDFWSQQNSSPSPSKSSPQLAIRCR